MIPSFYTAPPFLFTVASYDDLANAVDQETFELSNVPHIQYFTTSIDEAKDIARTLPNTSRKSILKLQTNFFANRVQPIAGYPTYWIMPTRKIFSISKQAICDITILETHVPNKPIQILPKVRPRPWSISDPIPTLYTIEVE